MANLRCLSPATLAAVLVVILAVALPLPTMAQTPLSPCTASMLTSFTPCMNFLSNSTTNMTTPTPGCCSSLKALATNGTGCLCQILSGGVPFRMPINRTSAISLPKSCNMAGVPLQCNSAAPAGASASAPAGSTPAALSPTAASSPSPSASVIPTVSSPTPSESPVSDTNPAATSPTATSPTEITPTSSSVTPGKTSTATSAAPFLGLSPSLLLVPVALLMMKYY